MPRVLHFGPGNFHRAHQAWYTQNAGGWAITGVSLRSATLRDAVAGQGCGYTLVMQDADGVTDQWIDVIDQLLVATEDPQAVLDLIASPEVKVITATVTEKGYCLRPDGTLDLEGVIAAEIAAGQPTSFIGYLAHGLAARHSAGAGPISVVSCDNLSHNGDLLRAAVMDFCKAAGLALDPAQLAFPNTMVDRITPRPTPALAADVQRRTGRADASPVVTETFSEWIIADEFAGPHPNWSAAGAQLVADVAPFEMRKLRMLNGAHSLLAYLGQLRGHVYVHEAIADPDLRADVEALMQDAMVTLSGDPSDLAVYQADLLQRFANPGLAHALAQIAMDGSQKMPVRCLAVIDDLLARGHVPQAHLKALAAWIVFVLQAEALEDPRAADLLGAQAAADPVEAVLAVIDVTLPPAVSMELRGAVAGLRRDA